LSAAAVAAAAHVTANAGRASANTPRRCSTKYGRCPDGRYKSRRAGDYSSRWEDDITIETSIDERLDRDSVVGNLDPQRNEREPLTDNRPGIHQSWKTAISPTLNTVLVGSGSFSNRSISSSSVGASIVSPLSDTARYSP